MMYAVSIIQISFNGNGGSKSFWCQGLVNRVLFDIDFEVFFKPHHFMIMASSILNLDLVGVFTYANV